MDDLLANLGCDTIGLNLVCDAPEPSASGAAKQNLPPAKRKKRNKYERRRERARRAKEEKGGIRRNVQRDAPDAAEGSGVEEEEVASRTANSSTGEEAPRVEPTTNSSAEGEVGAFTRSNDVPEATDDASSDRQASDADDGGEGSNDDAQKRSAQNLSGGVAPRTEEAPESIAATGGATRVSRRVHDTDLLRDERKRAEYMSTYHARPHEIDRRSGAVRTIKPSRESSHIFADIDGQVLDGDEGGKGEEARAATDVEKCPFQSMGLHPRLAAAASSKRGPFGYDRPTIIQTNAVSALLSKRSNKLAQQRPPNLFIQSETGSGKTLAYLLPIVQSLAIDKATNEFKKVDRRLGGTRCIILSPTRELATQTATMAEKLCLRSFSWLVPGCLSGGEKRKSEKARLRKGMSILIATPGRLLDHLGKTDCLAMALKGKLEWLVLDEADRLLDMGLGGQVEEIVQRIRANQPRSGPKRDGITWRSVLVSATVTDKIECLAKKTLGGDSWVWARARAEKGDDTIPKDSSVIDEADAHELSGSVPRQLAQLHVTVSAKLRLATLVAFLTARVKNNERVVVFMSTCDGVEFHHALFRKIDTILQKDNDDDSGNGTIFGDACSIFRLHGNVPHSERQSILKKFAEGSGASSDTRRASILIATDVAARGLNLPGVDWIVQYDAPCETADYIHRAGRAARAGKAGHALLFLLPSERQYLEVLELRGLENMTALSLTSTLNAAANVCPDLTAEGQSKSGGGYGHGSSSREGEAFAAAIQNRLEGCVVDDDAAHKEALARKLKETKKRGTRKALKNAIGSLHESAVKAFSAYIRSYPAKEKAVRHIFSPRALHLGHIARSFALKEQPKALRDNRREIEADGLDDDVLKSTGKKRNSRLAFESTGKSGKEEVESMPRESSKSAASDRKKKPRHEKARDLIDASDWSAYESVRKQVKNKVHDFAKEQKFSSPENAQARMMAAAKRMQSNGMEFF